MNVFNKMRNVQRSAKEMPCTMKKCEESNYNSVGFH